MSFLKKIFGAKKEKNVNNSSEIVIHQPLYIRTDKSQSGTYEVYSCTDAESAKTFLEKKKVEKELYYIVVETPQGNWGLDIKGLYLERLLPFQRDLKSAKCEGQIVGFPELFGLEMAAKGYNDNFISKVQCGNCNYQWKDALQYKKTTVVRCAQCKTLNKIDSSNLNVTFY
jgi:ssDNA-binding Zn-finger/Zn-ribbon topoisomerase 1